MDLGARVGSVLRRAAVRLSREASRRSSRWARVAGPASARAGDPEVMGDLLYRALAGRAPSEAELCDPRLTTLEPDWLIDLAHRLKATPEGARVTVHGIVPALRTYLRPRFDEQTGQAALPRLVFMHFMKVGGTSLSDVLAQWFGPEDARVHIYIDDLALTPPPVLATIRVLAGHIPFAALAFIPRPFRSMAVLRDPVERTISHYSSLKATEGAYRLLSLEQFVFDETFDALSGNYQARQLAHDPDLANAWRTYSPEWMVAASGGDPMMARPMASLFDSGPIRVAGDALLKVASDHLAEIDFVGTTDDLDGVARSVAALFAMPPGSVAVPRLNVSAPFDRSQLSAPILKRIEEKTEVDRELYQQAKLRASG